MSSLKDSASLIMIPSLYKDGRLDTIKPLGNSIIHPDATGSYDGTDGSTPAEGNFTFSRGSNLAATRVDVNGLIEKGRENLLTYSNDLSNAAWQKRNISVTGNQIGYDGLNNAWEILPDTSYGAHYIFQFNSNSSGITTTSIYAKANGYTHFYMYLNTNTTDRAAWFNLDTGSVGTQANSLIDATITDVGNDWYRCDVKQDIAITSVELYLGGNGESINFTGDGISSILFQDAQLEQGLVATDYIETGASTAQAGILEDMPRLDYSGGASCPSLLLEPQRSNILTQSEHFGDSYWTKSGASVVGGFTSPEGLSNAYKLVGNGAAGTHLLRKYIAATALTNYSFSFFVKKGEISKLGIREDAQTGAYASFDLENKSIIREVSMTLTYEEVGDYLRLKVVSQIGSNGTAGYAIYMLGDDYTNGAVNESTFIPNGSGFYIYGIQLEQGSYPTSYIPTYGTSQTRSKDAASLTGVADLLGDANGTLFVEVEAFQDSSQISLSDGTLNNVFPFRFRTSNFQNDMKVGGVGQGNLVNSPTSLNTNYKVAISYANNYRAMYFDGTFIDDDLILNTYPSGTLTRLGFDRGDGVDNFYGRIKQIIVFPTALTNAELAALTL